MSCRVKYNYKAGKNTDKKSLWWEADTAPLLKIEYLTKLYLSRMDQLGVVHS